MSVVSIPKPLNLKGTSIEWPQINPDSMVSPVYQLLVKVTHPNGESESISLRSAYLQYHPKYGVYLKKHYSNKHTVYQELWDYQNTLIETPVEYKYKVGQYGWITNGDNLEKSFVKIKDRSEYQTEIFFLHEELQKYDIQHYDITSMERKLLSNDEMNGNSEGWIVESIFTAIVGKFADELDDKDILLNWKICREDYLMKKNIEVIFELNAKIANRGILFRQTVHQSMEPNLKALRGKITTNNVGKTVETNFFTPRNMWSYFWGPTLKGILAMNNEHEFQRDGSIISVNLEMLQLGKLVPIFKTIKFYDQFANAFKLNANIDVDINNYDDIDSLHWDLINNMNECAKKRYIKLKKDSKNKLVFLRKVKYCITVNGLTWKINVNSGRSAFSCNVYRISYLSNGTPIIHGKIDD